MPIHDYCCNNCDHKLEVIQKMNDEPLKICPSCKEQTLTKLVSASSFRISGQGVYKPTSKMD